MSPEMLTLIGCSVVILCTLVVCLILMASLKRLKVNTMLLKYIAINNGVSPEFIDEIFDQFNVKRALKYKTKEQRQDGQIHTL